MTLNELLNYLDKNLPYTYLSPDNQSLVAAKNGSHPDPLIADLILAISEKCHCDSEDCELERVPVVNSFGPIRLKYMADDAPVDGFRLVERTIVGIDDAFNEEAVRLKSGK